LKSVANPSPVHNMPRGYMGGGEGSGSSYNGVHFWNSSFFPFLLSLLISSDFAS